MTELSFLLELLLNHELPKETKAILADRIRYVEEQLNTTCVMTVSKPQPTQHAPIPIVAGAPQAPSTLALMAKHGDIPMVPTPPPPEPEPVKVIAQTAETAAHMAHRALIMNTSSADRLDKNTGRPRKW